MRIMQADPTLLRFRQLCRANATEGNSELSELEKVQKLDKLIDKLRDAADREVRRVLESSNDLE
jgi:hypothetical protein